MAGFESDQQEKGSWREKSEKFNLVFKLLNSESRPARLCPLVVQDKVIGALNVYSGQPNAFDDAEIGMLIEVASDISLGIEEIR